MGALAADKAVFLRGIGKDRVTAQIEPAVFRQRIAKQGFGACAVAPEQVEHKALEIAGFADVHGGARCLMRVGAAAHAVDAGAKELVEHVVLVRRHHQLVDR